MKIGLIDCDSHNYPNLAQMKLSAYHKAQGDDVVRYDMFAGHCDKVYVSKVFTFSDGYRYPIYAEEIVRGGTGYNVTTSLPDEVEHIMPDYSLYGITDTAYGFLTRGCPRHCPFCIVGDKEGTKSIKVADLDEFWTGQRNIVLNDPNILACADCDDLLRQLSESRAWVDFNQGLDIRLMTESKAEMLADIRIKEMHFAWDSVADEHIIVPKLKLYAQYSNKPHQHNAIVYVLTNYNSTIDEDLHRIYTLRDLGYWPYVMVYDKAHADRQHRRLQRWVNNRFIFAKCEKFEDYR